MNMSFLEKIMTVFKYIGSSFLSIELFILSLLLFLILVINLKKKNKFANYLVLIIYISFLGVITISSTSYVMYSFDSLIKKIMDYIYFPSTIIYFFIILFSVFVIIYSMFSKKLSNFKKVFNYAVFNFMFFFFLSFVVVCTYNKLDISDLVSLYQNELVLAIVQISNLLLVGWFIITFFYRLFIFFKNKFDEKIEN